MSERHPIRFDRRLCRRRNVVKRCVGWRKKNRRIAIRYKKMAVSKEDMFTAAMIQRYSPMPFSIRTQLDNGAEESPEDAGEPFPCPSAFVLEATATKAGPEKPQIL